MTQLKTGAPIHWRSKGRGYIYEVAKNDNETFVLMGSGMVPIKQECSIVWLDGTRSEGISDHIAAPWVENATGQDPASAELLADLLEKAKAKEVKDRADQEAARLKSEHDRSIFIAKLKELTPESAKTVIIAELMEDKSDPMSDYFHSSATRSVVLAFSNHTKDLFSEMRKAALNFEETAHLYDAPKDAEHRQKYSMGGGYFLKLDSRHRSGWKISKRTFSREGNRWGDGIPTGDIYLKAPDNTPPKGPQASIDVSGVTIEQHTHTKKGFEMFIVILADRVERQTYLDLLAQARSYHGWYTRKWGATPAGFAFKDEDKAKKFAADLARGGSTTNPGKPVKVVDISEKLEALADGMQKDIDHKRGERLTNTPKRRREAASARQDADDIERAQRGLRALALLHKAGEVPAILADVKTKKAALELGRERFDYSSRGYYDAGLPTGKPAEDNDKARAFWALVAPKSQEQIKKEEIERVTMDIQNGYKIEGYFPTPPDIIELMLAKADLSDGDEVLEPSAGCGRIAEAVRDAGASVICVEQNSKLCDLLRLKGFDVLHDDFTSHGKDCDTTLFDAVLMNPPFERGQDCDHVRLAYEALKSGGRLVAIMSPSWKFRQQAKYESFRTWLDSLAHEVETLPSGSFKSSGTGVETIMVTIFKD